MTCDLKSSGCRGRVTRWHLWRDQDLEAASVSLCSTHGKPLAQMLRSGSPEPLPARPRVELKPTKLKTIKATRHLKKPPG